MFFVDICKEDDFGVGFNFVCDGVIVSGVFGLFIGNVVVLLIGGGV